MGKSKSSRKGKKEWRKNISTELHDSFLEKEAKDARSGGPMVDVPSNELFFVDKEKDVVVQRKVDKYRNKLTKYDSVLKRNPLVQAIAWPTNPKHQPVKDVAKPPAAKKAKGPTVAVTKEATEEEEPAKDIWDSSKEVKAAQRLKRPRVTAPAVEVDMPGCSYNPAHESHQDALAVAVAHEMGKVYQKDLQPEPVNLLTDAPQYQLDEEEMFFLDTGDVGDEDAEAAAEEEEDAAALSRVVKVKKLTKTDLNRRQRRFAQERAEAEKLRKKKLHQDLGRLKEIASTVEEEEELRNNKRLRRDVIRREKEANLPPRLGKFKYQPDQMQVLLTEEVTGSIRQLKGCYSLAKERYKSLQRRGIIEPRMPRKRGERKKKKTYEQGSRGQREREMHEATLAEREARKKKATTSDKPAMAAPPAL